MLNVGNLNVGLVFVSNIVHIARLTTISTREERNSKRTNKKNRASILGMPLKLGNGFLIILCLPLITWRILPPPFIYHLLVVFNLLFSKVTKGLRVRLMRQHSIATSFCDFSKAFD